MELNYPISGENFKPNTYILCDDIFAMWKVFYVNGCHELIEIELSVYSELKRYLLGRRRRDLKSNHIEEIKKLVESYHEKNYGSQLSYYHNMMCAAIVHPHLKLIAVQDALGATAPNLLELQFANIRFIVGVKPDNHKDLFNLVDQAECQTYQHEAEGGKIHRYRYINTVPLNRTGFEINFLEYWEISKTGEVKHFTWVTDIKITNENVYQLMQGGRSNWRIENNTFNTLKNQGYHFSHNFGHSYQHLCSVFGALMMLAFFIDQVQELCCELFKNARNRFRTRIALWQK